MSEFEITFIFDGQPMGLCPTYMERFKASDYKAAIDHMKQREQDFASNVFAIFLHDDRGAVVYHNMIQTGEIG